MSDHVPLVPDVASYAIFDETGVRLLLAVFLSFIDLFEQCEVFE